MGHLNGCMLLGFRNENKNETLELFHCSESRRRNKKEIKNNCYSSSFSNENLFAREQFFTRSIQTLSAPRMDRFSDVLSRICLQTSFSTKSRLIKYIDDIIDDDKITKRSQSQI